MSCVLRLIKLFPLNEINDINVAEYNQQTKYEAERIRDFIILHYKVTERDDSEFWRYCRTMDVPESLSHRIKLFAESGLVFKGDSEIFRIDSWTQVMLGQRIMPKSYHPIVNVMDEKDLYKSLHEFAEGIRKRVEQLPTHQEFVKRYCAVKD
jgi:tryptophan halogenase